MAGIRIRVGGSLEPHSDNIKVAPTVQGYSEGRTSQLMLLVAHLSRWLDERVSKWRALRVEVVAGILRRAPPQLV
jgi:hypothetical protein